MNCEALWEDAWSSPERYQVKSTPAAEADLTRRRAAEAVRSANIMIGYVSAPADMRRYLEPELAKYYRDSFGSPDRIVIGSTFPRGRSGQVALVSVWGRNTSFVVGAHDHAVESPVYDGSTFGHFLEAQLSAWGPLLTSRHQKCLREVIQWQIDHYEEVDGILPDSDSFEGLLDFLHRVPDARAPSITLGEDGTFTATWQEKAVRRLSLRFISATQTKLALVIISADGQPARGEVQTVSISAARAVLSQFNVMDWLRAGT